VSKTDLLTKDELADRFLVDPRTIDRWVVDGMPRRKQSGRYVFAWPDCYRWREAAIRADERATRHAGGDEEKKKSLADARLRQAMAEAEEAELNLAARRGELIPFDFVRADFDRISRALRVRLLSMPQAWSPRLGACLTTADRQIMLQDAINELMPQLRELVDDSQTAAGSGAAVTPASA
jgi:phage terminase Nu1 subunit (DNA packaging protein)